MVRSQSAPAESEQRMALNHTDYSVYHVESQLYACPADPRAPSIAAGRARHIGLLGPGIGVAVGPSPWSTQGQARKASNRPELSRCKWQICPWLTLHHVVALSFWLYGSVHVRHSDLQLNLSISFTQSCCLPSTQKGSAPDPSILGFRLPPKSATYWNWIASALDRHSISSPC